MHVRSNTHGMARHRKHKHREEQQQQTTQNTSMSSGPGSGPPMAGYVCHLIGRENWGISKAREVELGLRPWAADSWQNREPAKTENASGKSSVGTGLLIIDRIERLQRLKVAAQERRADNNARGRWWPTEKRLRKAESCKEQWREDTALRLVLL